MNRWLLSPEAIAAGNRVASLFGFLNLANRESFQQIGLLHVCIDDSGKLADSNLICFAFWISDVHSWTAFSSKWRAILTKHGFRFLHAKDFMRPVAYHGTSYDEQQKKAILDEFVDVVHRFTHSAFVVALDCNDFRKLKDHERRKLFKGNASLFVFSQAMWSLFETLDAAGWHDPIALIFDDSEEFSIKCYKLLKKVRLSGQPIAKRIGSICFLDDEAYEPVQAADLLAWVASKKLREGGHWGGVLDRALKDRGKYFLYDETELRRFLEGST